MEARDGKNIQAIEVRELTLNYGRLTAVDHIALQVPYGVVFGLLGANGAGKSSTIKMLTTLLKPSSGSASVAGFDIMRAPHEVRRHIGYVPQMLSADGALTGRENLLLSARLYAVPRADRASRIDSALEFMGLTDAADRLVKTYSGGMVRRLELAQAMLHKPVVLFLDEPTIGLDPVARHAVWKHLKDLNQELGMTILMTTHDMEEADHLCADVAILDAGRIAVQGKPMELKAGIGEAATLDDVFARFCGAAGDAGRLKDTADARRVARRLG
ncbi:MAG TPA: ATP-binding cassette domain-containing protein [Steroidobacteraceae bacterium]|nr:ATP-binding cassette domain-containing protein [Steroidobacteraceae bacterium]